jgi:hydroxyethylthiazole kinase-like uncharacterized protein yjeF
MIKVVSVEQMRAIERATDASGVSYAQMMEHAGRAVADVVIELLGEPTSGKRVAFLIGPGNNGGDGLVAARLLKMETEAEIGCYLFKQRGEDDPVYTAARDAGVFIALAENDQRWRVLKNLIGNATILVDALLGTGAKLPVEGNLKKLLESAKSALQHGKQPPARLIWPASPDIAEQPHTLIVAVDCPSGLDCDTGALDPAAIPADITVTFAAAKHGQLRFPGAEAVGELVVADISVPPDLPEVAAVTTELATSEDVKGLLPARPLDGHKGTFGRAVIVAGSVNYTGAAVLAGGAAYRVGTGLVTMAVPQLIHPILAAQLAEATWLLLPHEMGVINTAALEVFLEEVGEAQALLIGPGLGRDDETAGFIRGLLRGDHQAKKGSISFVARKEGEPPQNMPRHAQLPPLVIDADGLNLLTRIENWWTLLPPGTVLTPHPGEMARLTGLERDSIQADRFGIAASKASEWGCVVVLKGAFTVVAGPDGRATAIPFATDALATAGTGDVLSGCIVGLMAQGIAPFEAAVAGAYLHGLAGVLAGQAMTTRAVMAGDVMRALPEAFQIINAT